VVVGALLEDSNASGGVNGNQGADGASDSGAAYVFVRNRDDLEPAAYLKASNTGEGDYFWTIRGGVRRHGGGRQASCGGQATPLG